MNSWTVAGRIGKDAVTRHTANGKSVTGFSVAVDVRGASGKETLWVDCSMWGERGEKVQPYLTKGSAVAVSGEAGIREHNGKPYATLNVRELTLLGGRQERSGGGGQSRPVPSEVPAGDFSDDDIPFV